MSVLETQFQEGEWRPFDSTCTEITKPPSKTTKKKIMKVAERQRTKNMECQRNERVAKKKKEPGKVLLLTDYHNSDFIAGHIINVGGLPKVFILWFTPYLILLANMCM